MQSWQLHRGPEGGADPHCFMQSLSYCTVAQGLKLALTTILQIEFYWNSVMSCMSIYTLFAAAVSL